MDFEKDVEAVTGESDGSKSDAGIVFCKQKMWEAYREGYYKAMGGEQLKPIEEKAARTAFEQWFDINHAPNGTVRRTDG